MNKISSVIRGIANRLAGSSPVEAFAKEFVSDFMEMEIDFYSNDELDLTYSFSGENRAGTYWDPPEYAELNTLEVEDKDTHISMEKNDVVYYGKQYGIDLNGLDFEEFVDEVVELIARELKGQTIVFNSSTNLCDAYFEGKIADIWSDKGGITFKVIDLDVEDSDKNIDKIVKFLEDHPDDDF